VLILHGGYDSQARMSFEVSGATTTAVSDNWALGCYGTGVFSSGIHGKSKQSNLYNLNCWV
jgi:hypothetical protein